MESQTIVESKWTRVQLSAQDAEELVSIGRRLAGQSQFWGSGDEINDDRPRSVLDLRAVPGGQEVFARHFVGSIALNDVVLHVQPKIDRTHFAYLARLAEVGHRGLDLDVIAAPDETFLDVIANWFLSAAEALLQNGVLRDYRLEREELGFVRGRIHPVSTSRMLLRGRLALDVEYEEFDFDSPLNRVLQAAAKAVSWSDVFAESTRRRAQVVARQLPEVSELQATDLFEPVLRHAASYGRAIPWARRILWSRGVFPEASTAKARTFLIPTPGLIESAIRNVLADGLGGQFIVERAGKTIGGSPGWTLTPDLLFTPVGASVPRSPSATGDVKYKIGKGILQSDLYQAVTFATHFGTSRALVISFSDMEDVNELKLQVGSVTIETIHWRAVATLEPISEMQRVISSVHDCLASGR